MDEGIAVGVAPADERPSLGQVGFEAYYAAQGMSGVTSWADASVQDQTAWHGAAAAVVVSYDRSLFEQAEDQAVAAGLEPQPIPEITPPSNA